MQAGAAAAGHKRARTDEWPLDARLLSAGAPVASFEVYSAVRTRKRELLATGTEVLGTLEAMWLHVELEWELQEAWRRSVARMKMVVTPRTVAAAEQARQLWMEAAIELRAARCVAWAWTDAANRATVMLRRALPPAIAANIESYLF
jgi:hypothetical protein